MAQTVAVLLLMALAGYSRVYFIEPIGAGSVLGRDSRFHAAATLPVSVLTAMALAALSDAFRRAWAKRAVLALEAGYLAALFAFSLSHQQDFATAAERQRLVITQLVLDHPMMDPQATFVIRFPTIGRKDGLAIGLGDDYTWHPMLRALFAFPDGSGPVIRIVHKDSWPQHLALGPDGELDWTTPVYPPDKEHAGHIWYYTLTLDGRLTPSPAPIMVDGRDVRHDGLGAAEGSINVVRLRRQPYFDMTIGSDAAIIDAVARSPEAMPPQPAAN